jgi:hypothetical protein
VRVEENGPNRPLPYADPRSLSQAWYDALYHGARPEPPAAKARTAQVQQRDEECAPRERLTGGARERSENGPAPRPRAGQTARAQPAGGRDDDAAPAQAARRERPAQAQARAPQARTDLELGEGASQVKLLLAQRGSKIEVVAVCDRASREQAADALARARLALAARGIALEPTIRERSEA